MAQACSTAFLCLLAVKQRGARVAKLLERLCDESGTCVSQHEQARSKLGSAGCRETLVKAGLPGVRVTWCSTGGGAGPWSTCMVMEGKQGKK